MGLYIVRALKYFLKLVILITLALYVLSALDLLNVQSEMVLKTIFTSWRGIVLLGAIVLFSLAYPKISFGTVIVKGDYHTDSEDIIEAFKAYKFSLVRKDNDVMVFRADSMLKRLMWQFDDAVTVSPNGDGYVRIDGTKRIIPRVELRLNAYISNKYGSDE